MQESPANSRPPLKIFVRIGALRRFHTLKQQTADLPVEVLWDRRGRSSRADAAEDSDRRQAPPFTWEAADFVVVETPGKPAVEET